MTHLSPEAAQILTRPGCSGMRAIPIVENERGYVTALFFSAPATSDDHTAPYDQWLTITRGNGWVSVERQSQRVQAGDVVALPQNAFHRFWTENETMEALVFALERSRGVELVRLDRRALAQNAAQRFVRAAQDAIRNRGKFTVALAGGSTPRDLYALLATQEFSAQIDWQRVHLFWSDERCVPPDHPDSNFKMANDALIARVPIPAEHVHRIRTELPPEDAAREYAETLKSVIASSERAKQSPNETEIASSPNASRLLATLAPHASADVTLPRFNLILLGLGADAHTASLFPHTPALRETEHWVMAQYVEKLQTHRITFTPPLINAAENILFLVAGADKADAVHLVLRGENHPEEFPAQFVQPMHGKVVWLLDEAASSKIDPKK